MITAFDYDGTRRLIAAIQENVHNGHGLGPLRESVVPELEACLADEQRLDKYAEAVRPLLETLGGEDSSAGSVPEEVSRLVLRRGLSVLTDDELTRLALSPVALMSLSDYVYDNPEEWFAGHWGPLMSETAAIDMRRRGIDREKVIAKAKAECMAKLGKVGL